MYSSVMYNYGFETYETVFPTIITDRTEVQNNWNTCLLYMLLLDKPYSKTCTWSVTERVSHFDVVFKFSR